MEYDDFYVLLFVQLASLLVTHVALNVKKVGLHKARRRPQYSKR